MKNVQRLEEVKIQKTFLSMSAFKATVMSMETGHSNRSVTGGWDVVLRERESVSSKKRVDPRMVELRTKLLLEGDLSGASGQSVRGGNDCMLKEGTSPFPVAKCRFIVVCSNATAELAIFPLAGHLTIEEGEDAAANIVGAPMWVKTKVYDIGLEIVL